MQTIQTAIASRKRCDFPPDELFSPDSIVRDLGFWGVNVSRYDVLDVLCAMRESGTAREIGHGLWTVRHLAA